MILRRFMKHVTDQNWFAVGLDVIVVIVGIFLGLQVQEWNENRKNIIAADSYAEQLLVDANQALEITNNHFNATNDQISIIDKHLKILKGEELNDSNTRDFERAIFQMRRMQPPEFSIGYIRDVINGELPNIIADEKIVRSAIEFEMAYVRIAGRFNHNIDQVNISIATMAKYTAFRAEDHKPIYDVEQLRSSPEYIYAVQNVLALNSLANKETLDVIDQITGLIKVLEAKS